MTIANILCRNSYSTGHWNRSCTCNVNIYIYVLIELDGDVANGSNALREYASRQTVSAESIRQRLDSGQREVVVRVDVVLLLFYDIVVFIDSV